jgi:mono/diheme cytochrome c family protein
MAHHDAGAEFIHLGGGRDMPTIFGTFYAPNISVHPEDGIGSWTEEDFFRALRQGIAPDGRTYWPSFPYMAYTKLSDGDIHDLWAYIQTQPAVESDVLPHDPKFKRGVAIWRWKEFDPGAMEADSERSEAWNRGRYLVEAVGYCDQCHTPRRKTGFLIDRYYLAGGANPGKAEIHANLTPDPEFGLAEWTEDDFVEFLTTAETADGQMMEDKYIMYEKIIDGYRYMPESDKRAIAVYLMALEPINFDPEAFFEDW